MKNKTFARLKDAEKARKIEIALRNHTDNLLTTEQIKALVREISPGRQYSISVHPTKRGCCGARVAKDTIHIFAPGKNYRKEKGTNGK